MNAQERTKAIIENFRGNKDEFAMLKGVLCMSHGPVNKDLSQHEIFSGFIDTVLIADRMDEINREARANLKSVSELFAEVENEALAAQRNKP